jgi:hypothetical protein
MREVASPAPTTTSLVPPNVTNLRRHIVVASVRVVAITVLLLVAYFEAPIGRENTGLSIGLFLVALVGFGSVIAFQTHRIVNDPIPRLRAALTLGTSLPVFIVLFAFVYVAMAEADPGNFTQPITRVGALYFTVTVLSTVGFGDIAARTDAARVIVTIQMILDLVLIGVVVRVVIGASRIGVERRQAEARAAGEPDPPP